MAIGGLGKGLDALFIENEVESASSVTLKITDVVPNRDQPRKFFDEDAIRELADSIQQHGILQPLLVRPMTDGTYQLVAGERRWRAANIAGLQEVPVVIREMSDQDADTFALIENLQREDLNPIEEAKGYKSLMDSYKITQDETATLVNKSRPAVANALRLLNLPDDVAELVVSGDLSAGHARALLGLDKAADQSALAKEAVEKKMTVRDVERSVRSITVPAKKTTKKESRPTFYNEVELALKEALGRKVKVVEAKNGHGFLQLEFYDKQDLQTLANSFVPQDKKE